MAAWVAEELLNLSQMKRSALSIYTTDHHHTGQVARAQVEYVRQWVVGKRPPAQVATGGTTIGARSVCTNG